MSTDALPPATQPHGIFGPLPPGGPAPTPAGGGGAARVQRPDRDQVVIFCESLNQRLPESHPARVVWDFVASADLAALYDAIQAVEGRAGRPAIDPRILLALWLYATLDGVGSAREIDRLCREHEAYRWVCGGVPVNYHALADFRTAHVEVLDKLLTDGVAALMSEGLVTLNRVAQDGVRVRASAGADSFRRQGTLEACQKEAREQMEKLREELEGDPAAASKRQQASRQRAARERAERVGRALEEVKELQRKRAAAAPAASGVAEAGGVDATPAGVAATKASATPDAKADEDHDKGDGGGPAAGPGVSVPAAPASKKKPSEPRASTTDPDAHVMKMGDGGFRPAYNVQLATDTGGRIITGVEVVTSGSDQGQMIPMLEQHQDRYEQTPGEELVDGGFANKQDIERASSPAFGTTVYAPVPKPRKDGQDRYARRPGDSDAVADWRARMGTAAGHDIYKERASTAEWSNAMARNRGLQQFLVRGLAKVKAVVLLFALAHNVIQAAVLRAAAAVAAG